VTTIQKLNNAINPKSKHLAKMQAVANKRIIFIFDECHRSQFGETHKRITQFFTNFQMFGFTGTPIFADNASKNEHGKRTTKDLFGTCLHKYVITNAIKDENVLKFSVEYWGRLRRKDGSLIDEKVAAIDTKEFFEDPDRIEKIVDWIIENHDRKTHQKAFTAMRIMNVLKTFSQFMFADLYMKEQQFEDYKSKYLDIFDRTKAEPEQAASIVKDVDFELELIHRDEINVAYILKLLADLHKSENSDTPGERDKAGQKKRGILDLLGSETQLRSKRELIERFIKRNLPQLPKDADIEEAFHKYWEESKKASYAELCESEQLDPACIRRVLDQYNFTGRVPLRDEIVACMKIKPKILERKPVTEHIIAKLLEFIQTFEDSVGEV
jgi:type I site-specific restriction-modification system R (restriction) subunit